jgi:hypothetical protein
MNVDETTINHNAVRLIREMVSCRYEMIFNDDERAERGNALMTIAEIAGVCEMAEALKEVLKA